MAIRKITFIIVLFTVFIIGLLIGVIGCGGGDSRTSGAGATPAITMTTVEGQRILRNDLAGYDVAVPPGFTAEIQPDGSASFEQKTADDAITGAIAVMVHQNPARMRLLDFISQRDADFIAQGCDQLVGCQRFENPSNITVDGRPALRFGPIGLSEEVIFIEGEGKIFELTTIDSVSQLEQILSTLRFRR